MKIEHCEISRFAVIGKEGSTLDGKDFIARLWQQANEHFEEVAPLAQRDANGNPIGFWGAMSDMSRSFKPWEDHFSKGLYLAGVQCPLEAQPPAGWNKWVIPAYEYLFVENVQADTFVKMLDYLEKNHFNLAGAVHDFTCPQTGKGYLFFPIKKL